MVALDSTQYSSNHCRRDRCLSLRSHRCACHHTALLSPSFRSGCALLRSPRALHTQYPPGLTKMYLPTSLLALLSLLLHTSHGSASEAPKAPIKPCTLHSPSSGSFFDLRPLQAISSSVSKSKEGRTESWHAKGYDYGSNFTLNFCGPVVEELEDVNDVDESRWRNVSAFYRTGKGRVYSIGQQSADPIFRGRKLVLNYTDGSPCPALDDHGNPKVARRKIIGDDDDGEEEDDDDDDDDEKPSKKLAKSTSIRRKSTLISFLCDRDPSLTDRPQVSFVGSPDHCSYFFEVRSRYACGGASASGESGSLGPAGVFAVILAIALMAYLVGGCAYQRTVMHQRGWRQCPNYSVWAGLISFVGVSNNFMTSPLRKRGVKLPTNRSD